MATNPRRLGVIMDPIERIVPYKDSTLAMLLAATAHDFELLYFTLDDLQLLDGVAIGSGRPLKVMDDNQHWFELGDARDVALGELNVLLMRKDPPFDMEYVYATYILERAELAGALVVNRPQSLRDVNEKAYTAWFPELCPPTLITRSMARMDRFLQEHGKIVVKPLDGMGGKSIFVVKQGDPNRSVIFETLTDNDQRFAMAQGFIPDISAGDKRILIVHGQIVPYCLARVPAEGEARGNLAAGGRGVPQPLSDTDRQIARTIAPTLVEKGLWFVGLDVIGDRVTEINVTSPTCIRELDNAYDLDIAGDLMKALLVELNAR
ncbi:MAG: glutathione synthase [Gammaproteobacteria bacterium]